MTPQQVPLSGVIICPASKGGTAVKGELHHHRYLLQLLWNSLSIGSFSSNHRQDRPAQRAGDCILRIQRRLPYRRLANSATIFMAIRSSAYTLTPTMASAITALRNAVIPESRLMRR